jgi:hypothetical protein
MRARTRFGTDSPFGAPTQPSPTARRYEFIAERRKPPGRMARAAHTTENAICVESPRGGHIERPVHRAAYAAPLKEAGGRLAVTRYRKCVREHDSAPTHHSERRPSRRLRLGGKRGRRKTARRYAFKRSGVSRPAEWRSRPTPPKTPFAWRAHAAVTSSGSFAGRLTPLR